MDTQKELFKATEPKAHARRTDRRTSKAAAESLTPDNLRASQAYVLSVVRRYGPLDDGQLIRFIREEAAEEKRKPMSDSGARSRRSELSKPNEDRLEALRRSLGDTPEAEPVARSMLLAEGVRGPVWSCGERTNENGRKMTLWECVPADAYKRWLSGGAK